MTPSASECSSFLLQSKYMLSVVCECVRSCPAMGWNTGQGGPRPVPRVPRDRLFAPRDPISGMENGCKDGWVDGWMTDM